MDSASELEYHLLLAQDLKALPTNLKTVGYCNEMARKPQSVMARETVDH